MQGISGDAATGSMQGGDSRKRGRQIGPLWGGLDREVDQGENQSSSLLISLRKNVFAITALHQTMKERRPLALAEASLRSHGQPRQGLWASGPHGMVARW